MALITVYYTKKFETGVLKGISVNCHLTGDMNHLSGAYFKGKRGKDVITKDKYIITDASFQNYVR